MENHVSKQCRPWSDATLCGIWSGSSLFAKVPLLGYPVYKGLNNVGWCLSEILGVAQTSLLNVLIKEFSNCLSLSVRYVSILMIVLRSLYLGHLGIFLSYMYVKWSTERHAEYFSGQRWCLTSSTSAMIIQKEHLLCFDVLNFWVSLLDCRCYEMCQKLDEK